MKPVEMEITELIYKKRKSMMSWKGSQIKLFKNCMRNAKIVLNVKAVVKMIIIKMKNKYFTKVTRRKQ